MTQVEPEDLESIAPLAEIRLLGVARRRIARETRRDDQPRAATQQLQASLIADLDASAGQQRYASAQIRELGARGEVLGGTGRTQLVVERMDLRVRLLADVAVAIGRGHARRRHRFATVNVARLEILRWKGRRRRDRGAPPQRANASGVQHRLLAFNRGDLSLARFGSGAFANRSRIRRGERRDRAMEPSAIGDRQIVQQTPVGGHPLQQLGQLAQRIGRKRRLGRHAAQDSANRGSSSPVTRNTVQASIGAAPSFL